jgi:ADP-heptose:LPS heptosyltransferase
MYVALWSANPYVSKVYAIKKEVKEVLPLLKNERYTAVIDLHSNLRTLQLRYYLWNLPFYSVKKGAMLRWFFVLTGIKPITPKHIVTRYFDAVRPLKISYDGKGLDFFIPEMNVLVPQNPYLVFVLGAGHFTKRLPPEKWKEIADLFTQWDVLLIGGNEEMKTGEFLATCMGNRAFNYCGKLNMVESAYVIREAKLIISGDTGMMHIAAALRKPLISIWGGTIPEFGWLPFYPEGRNRNKTVQVDSLSCRPCSRFGRVDCPKKHFRCMRDISAATVYQHAQMVLQNK